MAYAAELATLTDGLVEAITGFSSQAHPKRFASLRDASARKLRYHPFLRTNQFDIATQLEGLEERFRVNCRDGLADALNRSRLELDKIQSKFHPDILHLLLELCDHPVTKTSLDDVKALKKDDEELVKPLRWEDIAREDSWDRDDPSIWDTIQYNDDSDDDVATITNYSISSNDISSDADNEILEAKRTDFLVEPDGSGQHLRIKEAQQWRRTQPAPDSAGRVRKVPVSEFSMVREVLFMLQGLPTTLFRLDYSPDPAFQLENIAWETHKNLSHIFSESGSKLAILRSFVQQKHTAHHLQVLSDSIMKRLRDFDILLSGIEQRLIAPTQNITVSLLAIHHELRNPLQGLEILGEILKELRHVPNMGAFRYIEMLFHEINTAQTINRTAVAEFLIGVFLECFQLYLRLIRMWMEEGRLMPGDQVFFISESPVQMPLSHLWKEQFKLRQTRDGKLYAPSFVNAPAKQIFTAGKSIVILKNLGRYESFNAHSSEEPPLTLEEIAPNGLQLASFADLFMHWFDKWINTKLGQTSNTLKSVLLGPCGLRAALLAMESIYFMSNATVSDAFCLAFFQKIDSLSPGWNDHYMLTSIAQEAFASTTHANRIKVSSGSRAQHLSVRTVRDSITKGLADVKITYRLTWAIQLVVSEQNIGGYQAIFTFLLQIRRAIELLTRTRLLSQQVQDKDAWIEYSAYYSIRTRLLWFCTSLRSYLTGFVLTPACKSMHDDMEQASDVDGMLQVQFRFMRRVLNECCLGPKLQPIYEAMIDILQLTITLEKARNHHAAREAQEQTEISRISLASTPQRRQIIRSSLTPGTATATTKKQRHPDSSDDEVIGNGISEAAADQEPENTTYLAQLRDISVKYEGNLRFITDGLRAVARATTDSASMRWDLLAEMLEMNTKTDRVFS
ncbi:Gamma-tubulin complex component 5 [Ceratocystis lukuohia]|uniref:Spindle pole body component n=1 Tax=Ceratocystis lukuohia TaxID=2019550 RepID=A0ABR4MK61_9PEZI